jgi:hypothetical protein
VYKSPHLSEGLSDKYLEIVNLSGIKPNSTRTYFVQTAKRNHFVAIETDVEIEIQLNVSVANNICI